MSAALPEVGSAVFVVGNPYGLSHSVSVGVVSGLDRSVSFTGGVGRGLIQFTAPVFPGDGGGLLADRDGRMLGIVSTALNDPAADDASGRRVNGIGFAIPARELRRIAQRLREGQRVERGYLGLTAEDVEQGGVRVVSVLGDSPAQRAGLREGDVIQTMNDRAVEDFDDLAGQIERLSPGTEITLHGKRGDDEFTVQAVLGERPVVSRRMPLPPWPERWDPNTSLPRSFWDMEAFRRAAPWVDTDGAVLGVRTQPITETLARSLGLPNSDGALISSVVPGSPADRAGLRALDVIVGLNGEPVQSSAQLYERIRRLEPAATVQIDLMRDGETKSVEVTLAQPGSDFTRWRGVVPWPSESQRGRLELLEERVKALEAKVSELQKRLDAKNPVPAPSER
jgi:serine protease Do